MVEHHLGDPARRVGPREGPCGGGHRREPVVVGEQRAEELVEPLAGDQRRRRGRPPAPRPARHARSHPGGRRARRGAGRGSTGRRSRRARRPSSPRRGDTATSHADHTSAIAGSNATTRHRSSPTCSARRRCLDARARRAGRSRGTAWCRSRSRQRTARSLAARFTDAAPSEPEVTATTVAGRRRARAARGRSALASSTAVDRQHLVAQRRAGDDRAIARRRQGTRS